MKIWGKDQTQKQEVSQKISANNQQQLVFHIEDSEIKIWQLTNIGAYIEWYWN